MPTAGEYSKARIDVLNIARALFGLKVIGILLVVGPNAAVTEAAPPEVRGTWLTTTGPDHIRTGLNTSAIHAELRDIGINTVYVEAWKNGYTNFPSATMDALIGVDRNPTIGSDRDLLMETSIAAHRNQMIHIAWFEYGFASEFVPAGNAPSNPLSQYVQSQGWLLEDQAGNFTSQSNGFAWMNPAVPEVRQLLIDVTVESVLRYDLDGVQFDDRLAWPREFGWDMTTASIYLAETGRGLPSNIDDSHFREWRQSKVSAFAAELDAALDAVDPNLLVSVSPSVTGFSDTQYNAAWSDWVSDGLFDEFVPQVYRDNFGSYATTLPANVAPFQSAGRLDDLVVGIRFNGTGNDTPTNDVQQMIVEAATTNSGALSGHSLFYSKGLINNAVAMSDFYGDDILGPAPHPKFDLNHRPEPILAVVSQQNASQWTVEVPESNVYRVVAEVGGRWMEIARRDLAAGSYDIIVANATRVELLVSRRLPEIVDGDFNLDGNYNCLDIDALVANIVNQTNDVSYDMTGDMVVDASDLNEWLAVAGALTNPTGAPFLLGDADLDGIVDGVDFVIWNNNRFQARAAWCDGDWNADGVIDGLDFIVWNSNKFTASVRSVPESALDGIHSWLTGIAWMAVRTLRVPRKSSLGCVKKYRVGMK